MRAGARARRGRVYARVSVPHPRNAQCAAGAQSEPIEHEPGVGGGSAAGGDEESEPDVSAALQMGLGAALAGELSGDGVRVRARACVSVNCRVEPPLAAFLLASHFPLFHSGWLFSPFIHACPRNMGIGRPFRNYL